MPVRSEVTGIPNMYEHRDLEIIYYFCYRLIPYILLPEKRLQMPQYKMHKLYYIHA